MTNSGDERAVLYARISEDTTGQAAGVERQVKDARALAEARGWTVVGTFRDNDISALTGKHRPGYSALMDAVAAGGVDRIVVFHTSRLWRNRAERAQAFELLREHRVSVVAVRGPELDMTSAAGRGIAGLLGEFDTMESEVKSERVKRAAQQRRAEGRANGPVLYGWRREYVHDEAGRRIGSRDVVDEDQAAIVQEIVRRLLDGDSLNAIARDLSDRKVPTPYATQVARKRMKGATAHSWIASSVRKLALRPANVGLLTHNRKPAGRAAWDPIIDEADHAAVTALLSNPTRRISYVQHERRHLLTWGIGECGVCGGYLRVAPKSGKLLYVCDVSGCVGRREERVDAVVEALVVRRLEEADASDLLTPRQASQTALRDATRRAEELRDRLEQSAAMFAEGAITADQMRVITQKIEPQLAEADAQVRRLSTPTLRVPLPVKGVTGRKAAETWAALSLHERRAIMGALGLRVRIMPTRPGPGFDPSSLVIEWGEPVAVAS